MNNYTNLKIIDKYIGKRTQVTVGHDESLALGGFTVAIKQSGIDIDEKPLLLTGKPAPKTEGYINITAANLRGLINSLTEAQAMITEATQKHLSQQKDILLAIKAELAATGLWTVLRIDDDFTYLELANETNDVGGLVWPSLDGYATLSIKLDGLDKKVRTEFEVVAVVTEIKAIYHDILRVHGNIEAIKDICRKQVDE